MKKSTLYFLMTALLVPVNAKAFELYRTGARSAALGNALVALQGSESLFHNQAGICGVEKLTCIISCESRFLVKEFTLMAAGMIIPAQSVNLGFNFIRFGTGVYRNSRAGLIFGRKLGKRLFASVVFDYFAETFPENERPFFAITAETGWQIRFGDKWMAGIHVFNPAGVKIKRPQGKEILPVVIRCGTSCQLKKYLVLASEMEYRSKNLPVFSCGLEIEPYSKVCFRAGLSSSPLKISGGVGFRQGKAEMDISFYQDSFLGFTPVATITLIPRGNVR